MRVLCVELLIVEIVWDTGELGSCACLMEYVPSGREHQIALVWGAVMDSGEAIKSVSLGEDRVLEVSELLPNLQIKQSGLVS